MAMKPRTELGDIAPFGTELDESALGYVNGGQQCMSTGIHMDPPGVSMEDGV
ncbi:hypothetical protein [Streptosporangium amethystogenes]|uniref:hypothetical protein n=1 Tax=Streptosporangium amethystogenes TaxID=2002 RepID=UPI0012FA1E23|nr:hypothetical protein [Streptosporangium amethystogenes]